jgi:hypothetical protein
LYIPNLARGIAAFMPIEFHNIDLARTNIAMPVESLPRGLLASPVFIRMTPMAILTMAHLVVCWFAHRFSLSIATESQVIVESSSFTQNIGNLVKTLRSTEFMMIPWPVL